MFLSLITEYRFQNIHTIVFFGFVHEKSQVDYEESNTLFYILHHMYIFVQIILYNVSCSLPHVIHTDSTQYKYLQNSILSITSDHANV